MDTQLELLKEKWDKILESIRDDNELSNVAFKTWLLPLKVFRIEGNILKITAPFIHILSTLLCITFFALKNAKIA